MVQINPYKAQYRVTMQIRKITILLKRTKLIKTPNFKIRDFSKRAQLGSIINRRCLVEQMSTKTMKWLIISWTTLMRCRFAKGPGRVSKTLITMPRELCRRRSPWWWCLISTIRTYNRIIRSPKHFLTCRDQWLTIVSMAPVQLIHARKSILLLFLFMNQQLSKCFKTKLIRNRKSLTTRRWHLSLVYQESVSIQALVFWVPMEWISRVTVVVLKQIGLAVNSLLFLIASSGL